VPFLGLGYLLALLFDAEFNKLPVGQQFEPEIWKALLLMALATMVLNAIAIAASTRLGQVLTLTIVVGMFLLGLLSDWLFARPLANLAAEMSSLAASNGEVTGAMHAKYWTLTFLRAAVPNFQMFWLADAITQKRPIPLDYIATAVPYTLALVTGMLSVATMLFQRREVG
jgi:dipeptide/tripeptide permease